MAIRRTREEKIKIQQRREQEKFSWKEEAPAPSPVKKAKSEVVVAPQLQNEPQWLRQDLWQTLASVIFVLILLAYFYWRSLN